jgi:putative ABC transport system ATP-binding protein
VNARLILDALVAGLPYALNFLGIWLVFRLLNDFDLTVDGSFTLGAAVTGALVTQGWHPVLATVSAAVIGGVAGLVTAFIHLKMRVMLLLSGIITMIALYSVNLRIMGLPNVSFLGIPTIFSPFLTSEPVVSDLTVLGVIAVLIGIVGLLLGLFLKTEIGLSLRATGANPRMARTVGIDTGTSILIFLVIGNCLVGLSGSVTAQQQMFADINMGIGVILIGITSILLGEIIVRRGTDVWTGISGVIVGTMTYHIAIAVVVRLGLRPTDLRAFTSVMLLVGIGVGMAITRGELWLRIRGRGERTRETNVESVDRDARPSASGSRRIERLGNIPADRASLARGGDAGGLVGGRLGRTGSRESVTEQSSMSEVRQAISSRPDLSEGGLLSVEQVSVIYNHGFPNEVIALDRVSLKIPPGQFVTVIGSNGAGKSTLVALIAGSVRPTMGRVEFRARDISRLAEHERAREIARVYQDPLSGTCADLSIEENLALAATRGTRRGLRMAVTRTKRRLFAAYLAQFGLGLEERLGERAGRLSGGQRQALAVLMAVARAPAVLLLDEHTAALDPKNQIVLQEITDEVVRDSGCTVMMVTHNMDHAIRHGDRMIMLHRGGIIFEAQGAEKRGLTIERLVSLFHKGRETVITDEMLLN